LNKSEFFQKIITSAPLLVFEFLKFNEAKFFSNKVLPINNPSPRPVLDLSIGLKREKKKGKF
jgi:hypothetical protein